jgi:hypothetical protein
MSTKPTKKVNKKETKSQPKKVVEVPKVVEKETKKNVNKETKVAEIPKATEKKETKKETPKVTETKVTEKKEIPKVAEALPKVSTEKKEKVTEKKKKEKVEEVTKVSTEKKEKKETILKPETNQPKDTQKPQLKSFLHIEKKFLKMEFKLPNVPMKAINFDARDQDFRLDTLKHTKKYFYEAKYHGNVTVSVTEELNAEFDGTTLTIKLPVTKIPEETIKEEEKVITSRRESKLKKLPAQERKSVQEHKDQKLKRQEKNKRKRENNELLPLGSKPKKKKTK